MCDSTLNTKIVGITKHPGHPVTFVHLSILFCFSLPMTLAGSLTEEEVYQPSSALSPPLYFVVFPFLNCHTSPFFPVISLRRFCFSRLCKLLQSSSTNIFVQY